MKLFFVETPGNKKAVDMYVDGALIQDDIPYIPSLATDHRGAAIYFFLLGEGLDMDEVDVEAEDLAEVERGYNYMFNPKHVREAFIERQNNIKSKKYN